MQHRCIRILIFVGLAAFVPLFYYLAVVGGLLPFGAILLIGIRNRSDGSMLLFSAVHLAVYGALLYFLSGLIARIVNRFEQAHRWIATAVVLLLLAGVGAMPIFGIAHGHIKWTNAYKIYGSDRMR